MEKVAVVTRTLEIRQVKMVLAVVGDHSGEFIFLNNPTIPPETTCEKLRVCAVPSIHNTYVIPLLHNVRNKTMTVKYIFIDATLFYNNRCCVRQK